jgi:hypothetical protein
MKRELLNVEKQRTMERNGNGGSKKFVLSRY